MYPLFPFSTVAYYFCLPVPYPFLLAFQNLLRFVKGTPFFNLPFFDLMTQVPRHKRDKSADSTKSTEETPPPPPSHRKQKSGDSSSKSSERSKDDDLPPPPVPAHR